MRNYNVFSSANNTKNISEVFLKYYVLRPRFLTNHWIFKSQISLIITIFFLLANLNSDNIITVLLHCGGICIVTDSEKVRALILLDFSPAFHSVNHYLLINIWKSLGYSNDAPELINNYLLLWCTSWIRFGTSFIYFLYIQTS